jgi:hypothetical protein
LSRKTFAARTYDPTSGQWLTPDAYAGDVHDPMTQKPFMWNNNNPVQWSDPSGYDPLQTVESFLSGMWGKLREWHLPGGSRGTSSGGLSSRNMENLRADFQRGDTVHLQKFQDALAGLQKQYNASYEVSASSQTAGARDFLRQQYSDAVSAARQSGLSDSDLFTSVQNGKSIQTSLPSEQQSLQNLSTGRQASDVGSFAEGEDEDGGVEMTPPQQQEQRTP